MAKKKSSSSKITITKATTVKTPTIKSYTPSKAVNAAKSTLQKTEKARPAAYTSKYGTQITGLADAIANRKGFSYDYTKDALYQNYKDQYQRQAQLGMQNATAQAAALSGGYGNSYAATAGNLAYQENMSALNNIIPSLYEAAYNRYQTDLDNQRSDLSMYQGLDESDYAKDRDKVGDWQDDRNYYANRYDAAYNNDFNNYTANVSNQQWKYEQQNGNSQWRQQQNASNYWQNKDYQLSKKAKAAAASASKRSASGKGASSTGGIKIPTDIKSKVKELAKNNDTQGIAEYLNNMEKSGVLSADQSNYVWSVLLGYTAKDLPTYITSDGTTTRGLSKYPTYDSAVAAGADAKTTLSYVDFMRNLPSSRELQTVGSYNDYLEKQVNKNKKKQSSKKSKKKK